MSYSIKSLDVWAADLVNQPGTLARVLEGLTLAGARLDFIVARKVSDTTSRVYLSPISGKKQKQAAADVGVVSAAGMHAIRIEGPDRPGLAATITRSAADAGINIRGVAGAVIGRNMVMNLAFEGDTDPKRAMKVVRDALKTRVSKK